MSTKQCSSTALQREACPGASALPKRSSWRTPLTLVQTSVQISPETLSGFPMTQAFREAASELDTPLAWGLVAHLNTELVE